MKIVCWALPHIRARARLSIRATFSFKRDSVGSKTPYKSLVFKVCGSSTNNFLSHPILRATMSNQQPSGPNHNNTPFETQPIRFEDISDEYIAQLLSGYWPQPQNASLGTSQGMDIPIPFSRTSVNASTSSYQPPQNSTLPAPPAIVPGQEYHQFTFDELMRQIDRERELALVPLPGDAAMSRQTTSLQRSQQAQRFVNGSFNRVPFLTNFYY